MLPVLLFRRRRGTCRHSRGAHPGGIALRRCRVVLPLSVGRWGRRHPLCMLRLGSPYSISLLCEKGVLLTF